MSEIIDLKIQPFGAAQQRIIDEYDDLELAYCIANLHNDKRVLDRIKAFKTASLLPYSALQLLQSNLLLSHKFLTALRSFAPLGTDEINAYLDRFLLGENSTVSDNFALVSTEQIYFAAALIGDVPRLLLIGNKQDSSYPNYIVLDCQEARFLAFDDADLITQIYPATNEIAVLYDTIRFAPRVFRLEQLGHILHGSEQPRAASD